MTFADLLTALEAEGALPSSRAKDCKTSLRYLAHALGHGSLDACPVATACLKEDTWGAALETHRWLTRIIQDQSTLAQAFTLALAIIAGVAVLAVAGRLLRIPEFDEAVSSARTQARKLLD